MIWIGRAHKIGIFRVERMNEILKFVRVFVDKILNRDIELGGAVDVAHDVTEHLSAPWLLQPEALFGAATQFTATVTTETDCHFITLSKDEVLRLLDDFLIIRLNLLNLLSTQVQRRSRHSWRRAPADVQQLIVRFLLDRCVYPAGPKEVSILMRQLARELNATRLEVSEALNSMQDAGLLTLRRGRIVIPLMEHLVM